MKLRNVGVVVVCGQLQAVFTDRSKWAACSMEPAIEASVVERYRKQIVAGAKSCQDGHESIVAFCGSCHCVNTILSWVRAQSQPPCCRHGDSAALQ